MLNSRRHAACGLHPEALHQICLGVVPVPESKPPTWNRGPSLHSFSGPEPLDHDDLAAGSLHCEAHAGEWGESLGVDGP